ncbi:FeoA family protein [Halonatronum saccharophilum]|uniref:FeoA family protein n=1 Tax=Halonatronum saccharophilum TaxID=150060 RepID=UPI0004AD4E52|nr:FeoA family protein [Halonatronum saccharophilum]
MDISVDNGIMASFGDEVIESNLEGMDIGESGVILAVDDHPLLAPLGFRVGKKVEIKSRHPFGGPIIAQIDGRSVALSRKIAREITIRSGEQDGN